MANNKSIKKALILGSFALIFFSGCSAITEKNPRETKSELMMGTSCRISLYNGISEETFRLAFDRINEVERLMSSTIPGSEIDAINQSAGNSEAVKVSSDTFRVIEKAVQIAKESKGSFDPSIGPLVSLWGIGSENAGIPPFSEIQNAITLTDYNRIQLDGQLETVRLSDPGMLLDLGGIAKGYAADEVRKVLLDSGVSSAIINLGGNVLTLGAKPDGSAWKIGVQDPDSDRGDYALILEIIDKAVVSSGSYERFFVGSDGKRYHHILDAKSGYPAHSGIASATIISGSSVLADALSTATFVMGLKEGSALIESYSDAEAIFFMEDHNIYMTSGLMNGEIPFSISNDNYSIAGD